MELLNLRPQTNANLLPSTTALTSSSISPVAGTSVTFAATVRGASGSVAPTGSVRFADQTGIQATVPLVSSDDGSATATFTTSAIAPATDTMGAAYSRDGTFAPSLATLAVTVTGLSDVVTLTGTPTQFSTGPGSMLSVAVSNPAGSTAATPTGYVELYEGAVLLGVLTRCRTGRPASALFYLASALRPLEPGIPAIRSTYRILRPRPFLFRLCRPSRLAPRLPSQRRRSCPRQLL